MKFIKIPDTEYIRFTNNENFLLEPYNLIVDRRKQFNEKKVNINISQNNNQNTNLENKKEDNENEKNKNEENKIEENKNEGKKPILLKKNVFFQTENLIIGTSNINPDLIEEKSNRLPIYYNNFLFNNYKFRSKYFNYNTKKFKEVFLKTQKDILDDSIIYNGSKSNIDINNNNSNCLIWCCKKNDKDNKEQCIII